MKQLIFLTILCLQVTMHISAQTPIVTMTTTRDSVSLHVEWTGSGSITANGVELKNDFDIAKIYSLNNIAATANGSVVLTAMGDAQLTHLSCNNNFLTALDVTNYLKLTMLWCHENSLTTLDVTNCPELMHLSCNNNSLSTLDITNCPKLENLSCSNNFLTSLDVTNCPELTNLFCNHNSLSTLDITNCPKLKKNLYAEAQTLTLPVVSIDNDKLSIKSPITFTGSEVDIKNISHGGIHTGNSIVWTIERERGRAIFRFTTVGYSFSGMVSQPWTKTKPSGKMQTMEQNPIVTMTTTRDSVNLFVEWRGSGGISANDVELKNNVFNTIAANGSVALISTGNIFLTTLDCRDNSLTTLDVTNCPELRVLSCGNNSLSELDITNCQLLTNLSCSNNSLTSLNIPKGSWLQTLNCSNNSLSALDVTNLELQSLHANDQTLTLPVVAVPNGVKLRIKNPITYTGAKVSIENISHSGTYTNGAITWEVSGESGEVTFDFVTELPADIFNSESISLHWTTPIIPSRPFSGTVTQPWTKK